MAKKGVNLPQEPRADMARRGTRAAATWHTRPRGSATRTHSSACVVLMWRGRVAGPHESMRTPGWHLRGIQSHGLAGDGPTGIVGLGYSIGAVTHLRYIAPPFILASSTNLFRVGLCSHGILNYM